MTKAGRFGGRVVQLDFGFGEIVGGGRLKLALPTTEREEKMSACTAYELLAFVSAGSPSSHEKKDSDLLLLCLSKWPCLFSCYCAPPR